MRITDRYQSTIERVAPAKPVLATSTTTATTATADRASILDIHMSAQAQELSNRAAGVEHLKRQIANGTFKVDPDVIASKIVGGDE
ncbi:MAG: flagellar biosynthesis anti-sigma factor FlgM [Labilithrix sp.]|nr:flagellar biosynthesis anti-sigma factor FlgM [Labilithrix sp.]MCW5817650.1 flagellar biosynthesis anti-sigma factor FlgM [Labilithrix sp.]